MSSPIQIILNDRDFLTDRDAGGGGDSTDFFWERDDAFGRHKTELVEQLNSIASQIASQAAGSIGIIKVELRKKAWAKSHRPVKKLFRTERTKLVGGGDLGILYFKARPGALRLISGEIASAEEKGRFKFDEKRQKIIAKPSRARSEAGAISKVSLYSAADRRKFTTEQAIEWLSDVRTGGSYIVELFDLPPLKSEWDTLPLDEQKLFKTFIDGLSTTDFRGLLAQRISIPGRGSPSIMIKLSESNSAPALPFMSSAKLGETKDQRLALNRNIVVHSDFLDFLDSHPLVRSVSLPSIVKRTSDVSADGPIRSQSLNQNEMFLVPTPQQNTGYPRVGVIDGGISEYLSDWVLDRWNPLADDDVDLEHGTFIGGLLVAGASMNLSGVCPETDGTEIVDIQVLPTENKIGAFSTYYPNGALEFFEEVEMAVADAKSRHAVRVFNLSLNVENPVGLNHYSLLASKLDSIAEENDVLFVISAGNASAPDMRKEWKVDPNQALADLAKARNDGILVPSESARNISVAAINPPGLKNSIAQAPAKYSRRGPGLRAAAKPDVAHYGGSGTVCKDNGYGLRSALPNGSLTTGCGTSYASPLVAKTLSHLDAEIEGEVSRETLMALLIHNSRLPKLLKPKLLSGVARDLVGFGLPMSSQEMLVGEDHEITLVFASRLTKGQQIVFNFSWPPSLVGEDGKCRGEAHLTLVSTPPLDRKFGSEVVRINVSAALQQEHIKPDGETKWGGQLKPIYLPQKQEDDPIFEAEQIEHGLKWSPVKAWSMKSPRGRGNSSSWRMKLNYLTRAGEVFPETGVPFTAILTIRDHKKENPVFNEMRQALTSRNVLVSDIRTAARVTTRT